jgi:hypothetical protein
MTTIITPESHRRALRSTVGADKGGRFGVSPEAAEIFASKGIDAKARAEEIRENRRQRRSLGAQLRHPSRRQDRAIPDAPAGAVKASLDRGDLVQQQLLNETAAGSYEDEFIGEMVAPVQLVTDRSGRVRLTSRTADRAEVDDNLGRRAPANRIPSGLGYVDYNCQGYGLESDVDEQLAGEFPLLENVTGETRRLGSAVFLQQELRVVVRTLFATTSYNASNRANLSSGFQWNRGASANPIGDMNTAVAAMNAPGTYAVMSLEVLQAVQENDDLRAILSANHEGLFSADDLCSFWGIEEPIVNRGQYAAAATPSTMGRILSGTDMAIVHANPNGRMRTFLRQYRMRQGANGIVTLTWYDPGAGGAMGFTRIKVAHDTHVVVVDDTYGYLIQNVKR